MRKLSGDTRLSAAIVAAQYLFPASRVWFYRKEAMETPGVQV